VGIQRNAFTVVVDNNRCMSQNNSTTYDVPAFKSCSTREILINYPTKIAELEAKGSRMDTTPINGNDKFGYKYEETTRKSVSFQYKKGWSQNDDLSYSSDNRISAIKGNSFATEIHESLCLPSENPSNVEFSKDIPIEKVTLEFEDDNLQENLETADNSFFLVFVSLPIKTKKNKQKILQYNEERGLFEQGFESRTLVLKAIHDFNSWDQDGEPQMDWGGLNDIDFPYDGMVCSYILNELIGTDHGTMLELDKVVKEELEA